MDRPEPKPSLLDDQPFLDRLSELDRQLDNESDGKRGPSGPGGKRKLLPAFREEEKAEPAAPEAPPVAQPPAASRPPAPVVHEPEILEAPAWSVEPTPAPVPPRPPVLPQEAVRPRRAPAPEPGPGVAGAAAGRTSPEADRAPVPDDADRLRPLEEEEEESPDGVLTYETFFGLNEKPFSLGSDPRFFYSSESHHVAFQAMLAAIRRREGIVVATGDVGMGKTTLCRTVIAHLDRKTFAAFIHDPFLSIEDLLKRLLVDFGVVASRDVTSGHLANTSRHDLTLVLHEFLRSLVALDAYAVVIIDEAQKLSAGLLEDIRLLCDLDGPGKLLQTVLIGQPSLLERLLAPEMRALDQRITVRCALKPLGREEIAPYVSHRLAVAGGSVTFTADATDVVHAVSGGVPRVINLVCDRALFDGARAGVDAITGEQIVKAADELGFDVPERARAHHRRRHRHRHRRRRWPLVAVVVGLLLLGGAASAPWWAPGAVHRWLVDWAGQPPLPPAPPRALPAAAAPLPLPDLPEAAPPPDPKPATPAAVSTPAAGDYVIQVGTFRDATRAGQLANQLAGQRFAARALPVDLGSRGRWQEVVVGGYASLEAAQRDLQRLKQAGDFADAHVRRGGGN